MIASSIQRGPTNLFQLTKTEFPRSGIYQNTNLSLLDIQENKTVEAHAASHLMMIRS